jgi:hypothetical protein
MTAVGCLGAAVLAVIKREEEEVKRDAVVAEESMSAERKR